MTRKDLIAFVTPLLIGVAMLLSVSCCHAQTPPVENQLAGLLDWRVILTTRFSERRFASWLQFTPSGRRR